MRNWSSKKQINRSHSITVFTFFHLHFSTCPWWDTHAQVLTGTLKKSRWYCNVQHTSLVGKDQGQKMEVTKPSQNIRSSFKVTSTHCQFETMILILQNSVITIFWCFMKTESLTAIYLAPSLLELNSKYLHIWKGNPQDIVGSSIMWAIEDMQGY